MEKKTLPQKIEEKITKRVNELESVLTRKTKETFEAVEKLSAIQEKFDQKLDKLNPKSVEVKFKKLNPKAVIPVQANEYDAGFDLTAIKRTPMSKGKIEYRTGLAIELPEDCVGLLFPRSSIYKKNLALSNAVGVIDAGYRGEIKAVFNVVSDLRGTDKYAEGERIVQLVVVRIPKVKLVEVSELSDSERGEGGFGSSGQ